MQLIGSIFQRNDNYKKQKTKKQKNKKIKKQKNKKTKNKKTKKEKKRKYVELMAFKKNNLVDLQPFGKKTLPTTDSDTLKHRPALINKYSINKTH